jgi:hypothetical protein
MKKKINKERELYTTNVEVHAFPKYPKQSFVLSVSSKCDVTLDRSGFIFFQNYLSGLYVASNFTPCPVFPSSKKPSVLNEEY